MDLKGLPGANTLTLFDFRLCDEERKVFNGLTPGRSSTTGFPASAEPRSRTRGEACCPPVGNVMNFLSAVQTLV